jgi:hypothetical protein
VLIYRSPIDLSSQSLRFLAHHLTHRRCELGTRWRKLRSGQQALLALAHLRCGDTYAQLAVGFGVGVAPTLEQAVTAASVKAFVILDGTLLPIDRIAADRPFHSGKHKKHGMNVQVVTDPFGRLIWASPALPGALAEAGIKCFADKGYEGAGGSVVVPFRGKHRNLSAGKQAVNVAHAKIRAVGEQATATLKGWRLLRKLRCSTTRITDIGKAVLTLQLAQREAGTAGRVRSGRSTAIPSSIPTFMAKSNRSTSKHNPTSAG